MGMVWKNDMEALPSSWKELFRQKVLLPIYPVYDYSRFARASWDD